MTDYTKATKMTGADVLKIHAMRKHGMKARQIAELLDRSLASVNNYLIVIDDLVAGRPIRISPDRYGEKAVREFCEVMGLEFRVSSPEEKPVKVVDKSVADEAEALATLLTEFAARVRANG